MTFFSKGMKMGKMKFTLLKCAVEQKHGQYDYTVFGLVKNTLEEELQKEVTNPLLR